MENLTPTKANLIKSKAMLAFAQNGYDLLDKKRSVLIREMMGMIDEVEKIQEEIADYFEEAYNALQIAVITMGINNVKDIAMTIPKDEDINILGKSIMGVEIPLIRDNTPPIMPYYGFYRTNTALDLVVTKMNVVQKLLYKLTEIENAIFKLSEEVKTTGKRANALDKIRIPDYKEITKHIAEVLEEKEREDFFRLKRLNSKKADR